MHQPFAKEKLLRTALTLNLSPSFSSVAEKLLPMIEREDLSPKDVAEIVQCDPGLATKLISIANSAYYSRGSTIYTIKDAILHIGLKEVKNLLACVVFLGAVGTASRIKKEDLSFIWLHSLFVAVCGKTLSRRFLIDDPEKVFTAALFHDIGKLVFFMNIDWYRENVEEAIRKKVPLCEMERERYGITHNEIGSILAKRWKFPETFLKVIRDHRMDICQNGNSPVEILDIVNISDTFFYSRDIPDLPYGYVLKGEEKHIEREVEKLTEIMDE